MWNRRFVIETARNAFVLLALVYSVAAPHLLPGVLGFAFLDSLFWIAVSSLVLSFVLVGYVFVARGASSRSMLFFFGCALVLLASSSYSTFGMIADHAEKFQTSIPKADQSLFHAMQTFVIFSKDVIGFGVAAYGANIAVSASLDKEG